MSEQRERDLGPDEVNEAMRADIQKVELELGLAKDSALDDAIRKGVEQGRRRAVRARRSRLSMKLMASALCVLLLLTGFIRVSPVFAAILRDIPGMSGFVELIEGDRTLMSAVNNEFIQRVDVTDSKNGYRFTVDGIIADEQRVVILYSGEGPGINRNTEIEDYEFRDESGKDIEAAILSGSIPENVDDPDSVMHDKIDIVMGEGKITPHIISFNVKLKGQWLEVDIPVDHSRFEGMKETITVDQDIEIGGQRFTIGNAIITPLQAKITIQTDQSNTKMTNLFINPALVDEKGHRWEYTGGTGGLNNEESVIHFQSTFFEKPKKLTFVADGLLLSDKGKTFVVNTETEETLTTPDSRIQLTNVKKDAEGLQLTIALSRLDKEETFYGYSFLEYQASFKDATGKVYQLLDRSGAASSWHTTETGGEAEIYYTIPNAGYKQPLTFEVYQYPGYVLKKVNVDIK